MKHDLRDVTFTIPVRIDMPERGLCLSVVVGCLLHYFDTKIIIFEDDTEPKVPKYLEKSVLNRCQYLYNSAEQELFHRTRWLNEMAKLAETPIVVNQDGDLSCKPDYLLQAANAIREDECKFAIPYDGRVHYYFGGTERRFKLNGYNFDILKKERCANTATTQIGGVVFSNRQTYFEIGGENESFVSWGFEDDDRMHRMVTLGYPPKRINGELYHFHHGRNFNSDYSNPHLDENVAERAKVLGMNAEQLREYIKTWSWLKWQ